MKKSIPLLFALTALALSSCTSTPAEVVINTPAEAISALKAGNARFASEKLRNPHSSRERRLETTDHQHPFAAIVTCSDSRVPAELIFDEGIGDMFIIRVAGNIVNSDVVMGSVDYAIDHLGVKVVVVLGHENCGGVTSAITVDEHTTHHAHKGSIGDLIEAIQEDVKPYIGKPESLCEAIHYNTKNQVKRIMDVEYISKKVAAGEVKIVGAYYDLHTGVVTFNE
ncbi:MAG: carbonic anhydrase [Rikenellaceae bacterium]